jgi:hypothetical protein
MNVYKSPFDNKSYSEYMFKAIDSHIDYFGITVKLYRSIVDETDVDYSFYQQTVDKRRYYEESIDVKGIVQFSMKDGRPRLTNSKGVYTENDAYLASWFKSNDRIKLYDLIGIQYNIIAESVELDPGIKYNEHEILMEVVELVDYGLKFTNQIKFKLAVARTQDIKELIKTHSFGKGGFGGGSTLGGG